jgi:hypothetical protein
VGDLSGVTFVERKRDEAEAGLADTRVETDIELSHERIGSSLRKPI